MIDYKNRTHIRLVKKYPNEMLWDILNQSSRTPISWEVRKEELKKIGIEDDFSQRMDILHYVEHFITNMVSIYISKGKEISPIYYSFYKACLEVWKKI